jgi:hypothetical protein
MPKSRSAGGLPKGAVYSNFASKHEIFGLSLRERKPASVGGRRNPRSAAAE